MMLEAIVTAFVNLASWNVNPPPKPEPIVVVREAPVRDSRGRFVKVTA